ncbi:hypothetical protein HZB02_05090 [Candidatus Woesearchaeota archaeon]|nr:hypothetical protein [Candidatus Woesearchaeota archaeon]
MTTCALCGNILGNTFLHKLLGTVIKNSHGKKYPVCSQCQRSHGNQKEMIIAKLQ